MAHTFVPDPHMPSFCDRGDCGLPEGNRIHADPAAVEQAVRALDSARVQESLDAPVSSQVAARKAATVASGARRLVLAKIVASHARGITDKELVASTPECLESTLRPRRIELARDGLVAKRLDPRTHDEVKREDSQVWVATELGRQALDSSSAA